MEDSKKILLVEDNAELNEINRRALTIRGYTVLAALTLAEARSFLAEHKPEVILLDVVLPDGSGFDFCEEIRVKTDAHILYLTSKTEHEDRVKGLLKGGDDYITKPYHPEEMLARVASAMRRRDMDASRPPAKIITKGPLTLNTVASQASLNGEDLVLSPKEYSLLYHFLINEDKILTADEIYKEVWNRQIGGDKRALQKRVSVIRLKLTGSGYEIVNEYGKGYCFREC